MYCWMCEPDIELSKRCMIELTGCKAHKHLRDFRGVSNFAGLINYADKLLFAFGIQGVLPG